MSNAERVEKPLRWYQPSEPPPPPAPPPPDVPAPEEVQTAAATGKRKSWFQP